MSDIAIQVQDLGKRYRITEARGTRRAQYTRLGDALGNLIKAPVQRLRGIRHEDRSQIFWALQDVSFEVRQGEVMGVIGRNGAGKSTLLKVLSRITAPTAGRVELTGRVGSLLEVGTGFHGELTGRENTYLNGAILGMSRQEIRAKFDEIVAFSEVEKFIDMPVKHYSSGMYMRLAFAVAAHLEPEILLVDEVLAVGDSEFQKKCLGKMGDVAKEGRTVLFVSHNMSAIVTLCKRVIVFEHGHIVTDGDVSDGIAQYLRTANLSGEFKRESNKATRTGLTITRAALLKDNQVATYFTTSETLSVEIAFSIDRRIPEGQITCGVFTAAGDCMFVTTNQDSTGAKNDLMTGSYIFHVPITLAMFRPGQYSVKIGANILGLGKLDEIPAPLLFELLDDSSPAVKLGQNRLGQILPLINWEMETK
jgi:lipopolysaccharide transport system ATP-binding protein